MEDADIPDFILPLLIQIDRKITDKIRIYIVLLQPVSVNNLRDSFPYMAGGCGGSFFELVNSL